MNSMLPPSPKGGRSVAGPALTPPRRWGMLLVLGLLAVAAVLIGAQMGRDRAKAELTAQTRTMAGYRAALLRTEIERYRSLPAVLSQDPDIRDVLRALGQPTTSGQ